MRYEILQSSSTDHDKNYLLLPNSKEKKYTMLDLKNIAKQYNLILDGYHVEDITLLATCNFPIICQIKKGNKEHFILLNKIKRNNYYIFDPSVGKLVLSEGEFENAFLYNVLIIKDYKKKKVVLKQEKISISLVMSLIFNLLASLTFFISLLFISDYLLFLLSAFLGFVFVFLQKMASQKFLKHTNDFYNINYNNLLDISGYQKFVIEKVTKIPAKLVLILALMLMLIKSHSFGYLGVIFIFILSLVNFSLQQELDLAKNKLEYFEQCRYDLKKVQKSSIEYGNRVSIIMIFHSLLIATFVLFMMRLTNLLGVDFFLMQFSLMFAILFISRDIFDFEQTYFAVISKKIGILKYSKTK